MESKDTNLISSISAENLVIKDIFCDDYLFTIPNYQRPYSWEEEHCLQLLDDLHTFAFRDSDINNLSPYFLGSAVIIKKPNLRNSQIVDGQQRLTTLTILLSCLRHVIKDPDIQDTLSDFIYQKESKLKGTSATYRLQTRKKDQDFFKTLIQNKTGLEDYLKEPNKISPKHNSQIQILDNALAFLSEFEKKGYNQEQLEHLATFIIQRCLIVVVASTDDEMAFRIFNVLNDRGKDLTTADILKSEILEKITNKSDEELYAQKWEDCEIKLGNHFKDFFSHLRAIFAKKKAEESVLSEIRKYLKPAETPEHFIDNILTPFSTAYSNILFEDFRSTNYAKDINSLFSKLKRIGHNDWIPVAIYFIAKHPNDDEKIRKFLIQLEKLTLGLEAKRSGLNERLERFAKINLAIENNENLYTEKSEFILGEYDLAYVQLELSRKKLYGKRYLKPILAKIEEQMNDGSITVNYNSLNIEHILPQRPIDPYWKTRFPVENRDLYTNFLGNLSLISVRKNSQASNYEFNSKIEIYFKADGKASNLAMVGELSELDEWTLDTLTSRDDNMVGVFINAIKS